MAEYKIDLSDAEVDRLIGHLSATTGEADKRVAAQLADQVKSVVEEPTERWSVVIATDADGERKEWGLLKDDTTYPWVAVAENGTPQWSDWKHMSDVEVLRIGVGTDAATLRSVLLEKITVLQDRAITGVEKHQLGLALDAVRAEL